MGAAHCGHVGDSSHVSINITRKDIRRNDMGASVRCPLLTLRRDLLVNALARKSSKRITSCPGKVEVVLHCDSRTLSRLANVSRGFAVRSPAFPGIFGSSLSWTEVRTAGQPGNDQGMRFHFQVLTQLPVCFSATLSSEEQA